MEQLIIVLILFALSGLSTVIQKWRQRQQQDQSPPSPQPRPLRSQRPQAEPQQQPKPVMDWEEQLRRLLEGEPAAPEPKPSPPPVVETRPPAPPPLPSKAAEPMMVFTETEEEAARSLAPLAESSRAYARATQLHDVTAARMREASDRTDHPLPPVRSAKKKVASPAIASALAQLRQPQTVQQAFVTALILGPPKALAPGES